MQSFYANGDTIRIDTKQKMMSDKASTIVVMKGLATTAGSNLHTLASKGIKQPTTFAITIVANSDADTARQIYQGYVP